MDEAQLSQLCEEIRRFLVDKVSKTGGHLGPNLGVVELTVALHRVFDSPQDPIVFDTGHQSYVQESSHASTALSYADGLAKAKQITGAHGHVVAVVGDGALTGGMCWEALNN